MSETKQAPRSAALTAALESVLAEGEQFYVSRRDGRVVVSEAIGEKCRNEYPQLYGRLLGLNAQLEEAGGNLSLIAVVVAVGFCVGLHLSWWDTWFGGALDQFRSFWFYGFLIIVVIMLVGVLANRLEKRIYWRERDDLLWAMESEGLNRDLLLAMIHGDNAVAKVAEQLKRDRKDNHSAS